LTFIVENVMFLQKSLSNFVRTLKRESTLSIHWKTILQLLNFTGSIESLTIKSSSFP